MLMLFVFLAVYAYVRFNNNKNQKWWYLIWTAFALGTMLKGAAAIVIPIVIATALLLDRGLLVTVRSRHFWQGFLLWLVIATPWHVVMYVRHGQAFVDDYFVQHVVARTTTILDEHIGGRYYYVNSLQRLFSPWFYLVPFAVVLSLKENIEGRTRSRVLLLVIIVVFGLYTVVRTKLAWYILPIYPALAILIASMITQAFKSYRSVAFSGLVVATLAVSSVVDIRWVLLLGFAGLCLMPLYLLIDKAIVYRMAVVVMCAFLLAIGFSTLFRRSGLRISPVYSTGRTPAASLAGSVGSANPGNRTPLITLAMGTGDSDTLGGPAVLFYGDRPVQVAYSFEELAQFVSIGEEKEIIMVEKYVEPLSADHEIHILARSEPLVYATIKRKGRP
jgi:hypothetical protein